MTIKVGFIGFGHFGQRRAGILATFDDVELVGFFDPVAAQLDSPSLVSFGSVELLFRSVDAVIISVPPKFAADYCRKALEQGVHVFCEKPPATSTAELGQVMSSDSNCVLAYGFNHRLHESIIEIRRIVEGGSLGNILWMRGRYGKETDDDYLSSWRCNKSLNGGGILIDQGIHLLDLMDWMAGGFDVVQALLSDSYLGVDNVEDNAFINLCSSHNNIVASLHSTITQWRYLFSFELFFEKGAVTLNGLRTGSGNYGRETLTVKPDKSGSYNGSCDDFEHEYHVNNSWGTEMSSFIESIKNGQKYPYAGINEAMNIMTLIEKIYSSAHWSHRTQRTGDR